MDKKNILLAHHVYFPSKMAHSKQIAAMIEGIAALGHNIVCCFPKSVSQSADYSLQTHLKDNFQVDVTLVEAGISVLPLDDELHAGVRKIYDFVVSRLNSLIYTLAVLFSKEAREAEVIYTRHKMLALVMSYLPSFRKKLVTELHDYPEGWWEKYKIHRILKSGIRVGAISQGLIDKAQSALGAYPLNMVYVPDAVSSRFCGSMFAAQEAKNQLDIATDVPCILYCGSLHNLCAPSTLVSAFKQLESCQCYVVGGHASQIDELKKESDDKNIHFLGQRPHHQIPVYLSAADVLVVSYASWHKRAAIYSSPLKIYEYIAARRPIVAPALPSVMEVLEDGYSGLLYEPDNSESMAVCIQKLVDDPALGEELAENAFKEHGSWSWTSRADRLFKVAHGV